MGFNVCLMPQTNFDVSERCICRILIGQLEQGKVPVI